MAQTAPKLEWCIVYIGKDMNWWVDAISDEVHWDPENLSILDPRQLAHIIDLADPLREYGFSPDIFESAFYAFTIEDKEPGEKVKLRRTSESLLESEEALFALSDTLDEEKGPYADFLEHITKLRLKLLNDLIDFEQRLTVDELEEELRERQTNDFMEGKTTHIFEDITSILEYIPEGYELEEDTDTAVVEKDNLSENIEEDFPDVEDNENIVHDETMKWDEAEEKTTEENSDR